MKKVVIIGAGPAGLTAAYELLKSSEKVQVTVLEETETVGGISRTVCLQGNRMDIGGHRFFSRSHRVMDWWEKMMPLQGADAWDDKLLELKKSLRPGGPDPETEDRVMLQRRRVSRIYYKHKFFDYPVSLKWQTIRNMGAVCTARAGFSYILGCIHKRKENSLEDFYCNRFGKVLYSMFFEGYTEKLWGRHPSCISPEWGAQRVKGLSVGAVLKDIFEKLFKKKGRRVETSLIEEFYYPKYGPGQLWETVAGEIEKAGGEIRFGCLAESFEKTADGKISAVYYKNGGERKRLEGDFFLSSMPVKDLVAGMPDAPQNVREVAEGLPYRDFVTVGLLVPELKIKNETKLKTYNDLVPDCWIYVQDPGVRLGRIQVFNNWSPYMVKDPLHTVFIGLEYFCREGDDFWCMTKEECVAFAVKELTDMGILDAGTEVLFSHRELVKKAYPAYFDTYSRMDEVKGWLDECDNLYCIGRNGQHRYNNMDHSMLTAFEAVRNILEGRTDKDNVWKVNTEQEYHEEG